jgi:hypothetical protein
LFEKLLFISAPALIARRTKGGNEIGESGIFRKAFEKADGTAIECY